MRVSSEHRIGVVFVESGDRLACGVRVEYECALHDNGQSSSLQRRWTTSTYALAAWEDVAQRSATATAILSNCKIRSLPSSFRHSVTVQPRTLTQAPERLEATSDAPPFARWAMAQSFTRQSRPSYSLLGYPDRPQILPFTTPTLYSHKQHTFLLARRTLSHVVPSYTPLCTVYYIPLRTLSRPERQSRISLKRRHIQPFVHQPKSRRTRQRSRPYRYHR